MKSFLTILCFHVGELLACEREPKNAVGTY